MAPRRTIVLLLAVVLLVPWLSLTSATAQVQPAAPPPAQTSGWVSLGPPGAAGVSRVSVSSAWPTDPFLYAARPDGPANAPAPGPPAARSYDGGRTWESIAPAAPPGRITTILDDGGRSWRLLDSVPGQYLTDAAFSPDFARDRTLYASVLNHGLVVSHDGGAHWASTWNGVQLVGRAYPTADSFVISPTFARDGTLFAMGTAEPAPPTPTPTPTSTPTPTPTPTVSPSWTALPRASPSTGSPSYPPREASPFRTLFRSRDRGATWEAVWQYPYQGVGSSFGARVLISPAFADNGLVFLVVSSSGTSPASGHCSIIRSVDAGTTWKRFADSGQYSGCGPASFVGGTESAIWFFYQDGWRGTPDTMPLPTLTQSGAAGAGLPTLAQDGTAFAGGVGGVMAFGTSARRGTVAAAGPSPNTSGGAPPNASASPSPRPNGCSIQPPAPFLAALAQADAVGGQIGCPSSPARHLAVRVRQIDRTYAFWTEDDDPLWTALLDPLDPTYHLPKEFHAVARPSKSAEPWSAAPDRVVEGDVLAYEGGLMLRLPDASGRWSTFVIGLAPTLEGWQEIPEAAP
jgi:hypothetical protein